MLLQALLDDIFESVVCENAGSYTSYAYIWTKDFKPLKERWKATKESVGQEKEWDNKWKELWVEQQEAKKKETECEHKWPRSGPRAFICVGCGKHRDELEGEK